MVNRTEKDFWIEMSVREIWTQAHFAEIAYGNLDPKAIKGTDAVFSSIHSFLSHCANVSRMLKATDRSVRNRFLKIFDKIFIRFRLQPQSVVIGNILGISNNSIIHNRRFRNHLEHYDERLKKWIRDKGINANIGTYNIGPKSVFQIPNMIFVSHYDPTNSTFTFVNEDFDLGVLYNEVKRIKCLADDWVKKIESGGNQSTF